jgi:hypothetical protein
VIRSYSNPNSVISTSNDSQIGVITSWASYNGFIYLGDDNGHIHELTTSGAITVKKFDVLYNVVEMLYNPLDDRLHIVTDKTIRYINGSTLATDEFVTNTSTNIRRVVGADLLMTSNFAYIVVFFRTNRTNDGFIMFFGMDYSLTTWDKNLIVNNSVSSKFIGAGVIDNSLISIHQERMVDKYGVSSYEIFVKRFNGSRMATINSYRFNNYNTGTSSGELSAIYRANTRKTKNRLYFAVGFRDVDYGAGF